MIPDIRNRTFRIRALILAVLVLLPSLWHGPLLLGWLPDFMDTVTALYPLRMAVARQWAEGTLPLWLPNQAAGYPLAANPQVAAWYPPHWLFFLAPNPVSNGLILVGHVVWGGLGLYAWSRVSGARRIPALFGAVGFQFGSVLVSRMALTPHLVTIAWIPWILWAAERTLLSPRIRWDRCCVVALFVALQFLAGSPQVSYYTGILLPLWWLGRGWQSGRMPGVWRVLGQGTVAAVLVLLLVSIQLLPTVELLRESARSQISVDKLQTQGLGGGFLWRALVGGTGPTIEDTDSINAIGVGLLLLIPLAVIHRRWRSAALLALLLGLGFYILSLGALAPWLFDWLPLYKRFHAPRRALMIWSILGPWLAVAGAGWLLAWMRLRGWRRLAPYGLLLLLAPTISMLPRFERQFTGTERFDPPDVVTRALGQDRFLTLDPTFRYAYDSRRADYGRSLMPDLAAWHNLQDVQVYDPLVLRRMDEFRTIVNRSSGQFYPSHGVVFSDPGHPALALLAVQYVLGRWDIYDPGRLIPGTRMDQDRLASQLEPQPVHQDLRWPLWRFRETRPLAWIPGEVRPTSNRQTAMTLGTRESPYETLYHETYRPTWQRPMATTSTVVVHRRSAREFHIRLAADDQGSSRVLALASVWMPGWQGQATLTSNPSQSPEQTQVPSRRIPLFPLNGIILGAEVPPGTSELTLKYQPASFRAGFLLTLLGWTLAAVLYRLGRRQRA